MISPQERRQWPDYPRSIAWELVAPHEAQAKLNHGDQDLETLARRGGLHPGELIDVLHDRRSRLLFGMFKEKDKVQAIIEESFLEVEDIVNGAPI